MDRKLFFDAANILCRTRGAIPRLICAGSSDAQLLEKIVVYLAATVMVNRIIGVPKKHQKKILVVRDTIKKVAEGRGDHVKPTLIADAARFCAEVSRVMPEYLG